MCGRSRGPSRRRAPTRSARSTRCPGSRSRRIGRRPALASGYGGICGPALRPIALRVVYEVAQVVDVPVIGIGGVATIDDVLDLLAAGASAVGVGVAALADPMLPVRLADELADACRARGLEDVARPRRHGAAREAVTAVDARRGVRPMSPLARWLAPRINVVTFAAYA